MNNPFPGMNPYLENPIFWSELHYRLITAIADAIEENIPLQYNVVIEQRTYLSDDSDSVFSKQVAPQHSSTTQLSTSEGITIMMPMPENVKESYLEIREIATGFVVTTIEIISPKNKKAGEGRKAYENKRKKVLASLSHLVEIDLLRSGKSMSILGEVAISDYYIVVSRSDIRPKAKLYTFSVQQPIPSFQLPLQSEDIEPILDIQSLLNSIYNRARYNLRIDYNLEPVPPLKADNAAWCDMVLREQGLRE
ncbi:hypothetical protein RIVM261_085080 [Rivularia sp. IAM M-261]|nr:hypothetical protein RIVM261_085080 [Rivularia sp. IAM M-261]